MPSTRTARAVVCAAALVLAGCGDATGPGVPGDPDAVAITARAVAAIAVDDLPEGATSASVVDPGAGQPAGSVGAELLHGPDQDLLRVLVEPPGEQVTCRGYATDDDGCVLREVATGTLMVRWDELEPEEDPGIVVVTLQRPDADLVAIYAGPIIRGDPRKQDLLVGVTDLERLLQDPRLGPTTDPGTVAAAEDLAIWTGEDAGG